MRKLLKKNTLWIIAIFTFFSCKVNKAIVDNTEVNSFYNPEYNNSISAYSGKLSIPEYDMVIKSIEIEFKTTIDTKKSILINYYQKAQNCIRVRFGNNRNKKILENNIKYHHK